MYLSKHFTLEELIYSITAKKNHIPNDPTPELIDNLKILAVKLEEVRLLLCAPIIISSGYRSPALNKAVGGAPTSDHQKGLAVDFIAPKFGNIVQIHQAIAQSPINFDQLILEKTWIHLGIGARMRRQIFSL